MQPTGKAHEISRKYIRNQSDLPSNNSDDNLSEYTAQDDYGNIDILKEKQADFRNKKRKQLKEGVLTFMKSKGIISEEARKDRRIF